MAHCCVPTCKNDKRYPSGRGLSFHHMPKDPDLRKQWTINIRREEGPNFRVSNSTRVCAVHFTPDSFQRNPWTQQRKCLKKDAVPTIFSWTEREEEQEAAENQSNSNSSDDVSTDCSVKSENTEDHSETLAPMSEHDYAHAPSTMEEQLETMKKYTKQLEEQLLAAIKTKTFCITRFSHDPDMVEFYTGFRSYNSFISTFSALKPSVQNLTQWSQAQIYQSSGVKKPQLKSDIFREDSLPVIDQFFMFLCRVRQDFVEKDLAIRFDIPVSSVTRILVTWANYLYGMLLGMLPIWQDRETINNFMPECFKKTYPNTRVLLDCTEIKVQSSSSKPKDSEVYSDYRYAPHSTMKGLVGISPEGMINFVSALYPGSISDTDITKQCGILDLLDEGDDVMADDGFEIQNLLSWKGANLIRPRFLQKKGQCSKRKKMKESEENARLRLHIEEAIQKLKGYHVFDSVIPSTLTGSANEIWTVCCLLTNFHGKSKSLH